VRTLEIVSSAIVEADAYPVTISFVYLVINLPPTTKMAMIVGRMHDRIKANSQFLTKAITNAEKNDAKENTTIEILKFNWKSSGVTLSEIPSRTSSASLDMRFVTSPAPSRSKNATF